MHIAGGGEVASAGAAEGVRGVDDSAAPAGSWQGWPGVDGVRAQELGLHAVHRERRDLLVAKEGSVLHSATKKTAVGRHTFPNLTPDS